MSRRHSTYRRVAVGLVAALLVTGWTIHTVSRIGRDSDIVELIDDAGRQRMLTKRLGLAAARLLIAQPHERAALRDEVARLADRIEARRDVLDETMGRRISAERRELMRQIIEEQGLAIQLDGLLDTARALERLPADDPEMEQAARRVIAAAGDEALIGLLDRQVHLLVDEQYEREEALERVALLLAAVLPLALVAWALMVQRPGVHELREEMDERVTRATTDRARVFELVPDLLCIATADGYFTELNAAFERFLGRTADELRETSLLDLVHPDEREATADVLARQGGGELITRFDNRYRRGDGTWRWLAWHSIPCAEDGLIYAAARDVTEERELQRRLECHSAELERSNQQLDSFAFVASHDLRAPLRDITNLVGWIEEEAAERLPDASRRHLELLGSRVARMDRLLASLLDYSRVNRGERREETVDVERLVAACVDELGAPAGFRVVTLGGPLTLVTEPTPLGQVLRNLIDNAVKHHDREEGTIEVGVEPSPDGVRLEVRDDGPGIAHEYHERIFGLFEKLRSRDEIEGSGMGLALVRRIVESRGGTIEVVSDGRGSCFRFVWPARVLEPALT